MTGPPADPAPARRARPRPLYVDRHGHPGGGGHRGDAAPLAGAVRHPELHGDGAGAVREGDGRDGGPRGPRLPAPDHDPRPLHPDLEPHGAGARADRPPPRISTPPRRVPSSSSSPITSSAS